MSTSARTSTRTSCFQGARPCSVASEAGDQGAHGARVLDNANQCCGPPPERKLSIWIGGSILSWFSAPQQLWITRAV
eukprot:4831880-Lingulodinium_polyedra.AAC.1